MFASLVIIMFAVFAADVAVASAPDDAAAPSAAEIQRQMAVAAQQAGAPSPEEVAELNKNSGAVVAGILRGFLQRDLTTDEKQCISGNAAELATGVKEASAGLSNAAEKVLAAVQTGSREVGLMIRLRLYLTRLAGLERKLASTCVDSKSLQVLSQVAKDLEGMSFSSGHVKVGDLHVDSEIKNVADHYHDKSLEKFGQDAGSILRKVTDSAAKSSLPKGIPSTHFVAVMSEGLVEGFFGPGVDVKINTGALADMRKCVAGNNDYFKKVWAGAWLYFGKLATRKAANGGVVDMNDPSLLGAALMDLPAALTRCHLESNQQGMIMDSLKALRNCGDAASYDATAFDRLASHSQLTKDLAMAESDWEAHRWTFFGVHVGRLMQDLMVIMLPQQYTVDQSGILKQLLTSDAAEASKTETFRGSHGTALRGADPEESTVSSDVTPPFSPLVCSLLLGGLIVVLLTATVALRSRNALVAVRKSLCAADRTGCPGGPPRVAEGVESELPQRAEGRVHDPFNYDESALE